QAEDGIRDLIVTGVQTCALPISAGLLKATVLENYWITSTPTAKQAEFLALDVGEAFFGGAAGGGKSEALLMAALQFIDIPGYARSEERRVGKEGGSRDWRLV